MPKLAYSPRLFKIIGDSKEPLTEANISNPSKIFNLVALFSGFDINVPYE